MIKYFILITLILSNINLVCSQNNQEESLIEFEVFSENYKWGDETNTIIYKPENIKNFFNELKNENIQYGCTKLGSIRIEVLDSGKTLYLKKNIETTIFYINKFFK